MCIKMCDSCRIGMEKQNIVLTSIEADMIGLALALYFQGVNSSDGKNFVDKDITTINTLGLVAMLITKMKVAFVGYDPLPPPTTLKVFINKAKKYISKQSKYTVKECEKN